MSHNYHIWNPLQTDENLTGFILPRRENIFMTVKNAPLIAAQPLEFVSRCILSVEPSTATLRASHAPPKMAFSSALCAASAACGGIECVCHGRLSGTLCPGLRLSSAVLTLATGRAGELPRTMPRDVRQEHHGRKHRSLYQHYILAGKGR
jgi:hypothetical protein